MLSLQSRQLWEAATSFPAFNTILGKDKHGKHVLEGDNPTTKALGNGRGEGKPATGGTASAQCWSQGIILGAFNTI